VSSTTTSRHTSRPRSPFPRREGGQGVRSTPSPHNRPRWQHKPAPAAAASVSYVEALDAAWPGQCEQMAGISYW
jgi:hypothetical protein